jgi:hypothetical protein
MPPMMEARQPTARIEPESQTLSVSLAVSFVLIQRMHEGAPRR